MVLILRTIDWFGDCTKLQCADIMDFVIANFHELNVYLQPVQRSWLKQHGETFETFLTVETVETVFFLHYRDYNFCNVYNLLLSNTMHIFSKIRKQFQWFQQLKRLEMFHHTVLASSND